MSDLAVKTATQEIVVDEIFSMRRKRSGHRWQAPN